MYVFLNSHTNPTGILILLVRKLRHREGKELAGGSRAALTRL